MRRNTRGRQLPIKRTCDVIGSLACIAVLAPVLVIIAVLIRLLNGPPVLYGGLRVGRSGQVFRMWKFRTMVANAEKIGGPSASDRDPRITRVGRFLRKRKLDELPQLFNVLAGDMSFVGPRPEVKQYVDLYTSEERRILSVRPGITDLASLWNSDEGAVLASADDPERAYLEQIRPTKLRLQLAYVSQQSFWTDLRILYLTAKAIATRRAPGPSIVRHLKT